MRLLPLILVVFLTGCGDDLNVVYPPTYPTPVTGPTINNPIVPVSNRVEYRVNGNAISARVRYSNALDGLTQTITTLPYIASVNTTESSMFLAIDVTPFGFPENHPSPFMSAQIFVNGVLFREASASDGLTISVSGTWRK